MYCFLYCLFVGLFSLHLQLGQLRGWKFDAEKTRLLDHHLRGRFVILFDEEANYLGMAIRHKQIKQSSSCLFVRSCINTCCRSRYEW